MGKYKNIKAIMVMMTMVLSLSIFTFSAEATASTVGEWIEVDGIVGGMILFDSATGSINDSEDSITSIIIPSNINGVTVTTLGNSAFSGNENIINVTIPDTITLIDVAAFYGCTNLDSVQLPASLTQISYTTFMMCSALKSLEIPEGVLYLQRSALSNCKSLEYITIPVSVVSIDTDFMSNVSSSMEVHYAGTKEQWEAIYGYEKITCTVVYNSDGPVVDGAEWLSIDGIEGGKILFHYETGTILEASSFITVANIPSQIEGADVIAIADEAFMNNIMLTSLALPDTMETIGESAFQYCSNLENVSFGNGLLEIGSYSFNYCTKLTQLDFPDTLIAIYTGAFGYCDSLTEVYIPKSVEGIGFSAFGGKDLVAVNASEENSEFTSHDGVLYNANMTKLILYPQAISLEYYDLPETVVTIANYALVYNDSLNIIRIHDTLQTVEFAAFLQCTNLDYVFYEGSKDQWSNINISNGFDGNIELENAAVIYNDAQPLNELSYSFATTDEDFADMLDCYAVKATFKVDPDAYFVICYEEDYLVSGNSEVLFAYLIAKNTSDEYEEVSSFPQLPDEKDVLEIASVYVNEIESTTASETAIDEILKEMEEVEVVVYADPIVVETNKSSSSTGTIVIVLVVLVVGAGAVFFVLKRKK